MSRTITLETTAPESYMDITVGFNATHLRLKAYRVDLKNSGTPYRHLGLEIGNIVNTSYIIDNQVGSNFFRIPISAALPAITIPTVGTDVLSTFVPNCDIPLTMTGSLDKKFFLRVNYLDRSVSPPVFKRIPVADLYYLSLTFEAMD